MSPVLSVVIPAFNMEQQIAETLRSVVAQTLQNFEIIVVDDGSSDSTARIAEAELSGFRGPWQVIRQANKGLPATRNVGYAASSGDWIHFMDADDVIVPTMLETLLSAAQADPGAALVYGPYRRFAGDGAERQWTGGTEMPDVDPAQPASLLHNIVLIPAAIVARRWVDRIGGFDPALRSCGEDRDFLIRLALAGGRFVGAGGTEPLFLYRMYPGRRRVGGAGARYKASDSLAVWFRALERCIGPGTLPALKLRPRDEDGIVRNTRWLLWLLLESGRHDEFERYVLRFRTIMPGFVPRKPRLLWALSHVLGFDSALAVSRFARRLLPSGRVPVADEVKEDRRREGDRVEPVQNAAVALDH